MAFEDKKQATRIRRKKTDNDVHQQGQDGGA